MMAARPAIIAILFLFSSVAFAQTTFTDMGYQFQGDINVEDSFYGCGVSFFDFNQDGWDDLSFAMNGENPRFFENNAGIFTQVDLGIENTGESKQVMWVDIDNDGDSDVFIPNRFGPFRLFRNDDFTFVEISETAGFPQDDLHESFGSSWCDFDRDGLLDVYLSNFNSILTNDTITNYLFRNLGDGQFEDVTQISGVDNGNQQSFQSVWFDYNNDLWPDLYVINDRLDFKNALYKNNGDGTFDDVSAESGTDLAIYAMSATAADYNNDGFQDLYITNGVEGNVFLHNNGNGTFTDITDLSTTAAYTVCWAANFFDHDNDRLQDLHVAVWSFENLDEQNHFWINQGSVFFEYDTDVFPDDISQGYSTAIGDLNNDGFHDLVMHNDAPYAPTLWQCGGNDNHYLKVGLEGVWSNRDGVGTLITATSDGQAQFRYTRSGEDYLNQDSEFEIFGMGESESPASVALTWPSGLFEEYEDLDIDTTYYFIEGASFELAISSESNLLCAEDTLSITAGLNVQAEVIWNDESTGSTLEVQEPGPYSYSAVIQGITFYSDTIWIEAAPSTTFEILVEDVSCAGDLSGSVDITLIAGPAIDQVNWEGQAVVLPIDGMSAGMHQLEIINELGCSSFEEIMITEPDSLLAIATVTHPLCWDGLGAVTLDVTGGTGMSNIDSAGFDFNFLWQGSYQISVTDSLGCEVIAEFEVIPPDQIEGEVETTDDLGDGGGATVVGSGGTGPLEILWSTDDEGWTIDGLMPGDYWVMITDSVGCSIALDFTILDLGIGDYPEHEILVFPNPANSVVTVTLEPAFTKITIHDALGSVVYHRNLNSNNTLALDVSHWSSGLYFLQLRDQFGRLAQTGILAVSH